MISLYAQKLALNKSMRASEGEQGTNKLWPNINLVICNMHDTANSCIMQSQGMIHLGRRREN